MSHQRGHGGPDAPGEYDTVFLVCVTDGPGLAERYYRALSPWSWRDNGLTPGGRVLVRHGIDLHAGGAGRCHASRRGRRRQGPWQAVSRAVPHMLRSHLLASALRRALTRR
jgi:hypothetical protein